MRIRGIISAVLAASMLASSTILASCSDDKDKTSLKYDSDGKLIIQTLKGEEHIKVKSIKGEELSKYSVMCADLASTALADDTMTFYDEVNDNIASLGDHTTDWVDRGSEVPTGTKEVLIGFTNRPESPDESQLRLRDFVIKYENDRLVICGGSDDATRQAVEYYIANFVDKTRKEIVVPDGQAVEYSNDYVLDTAKVNGVSLADYKIRTGKGLGSGGDSIKEFVSSMTGFAYKGKGSNTIRFEDGAEAGTCSVACTDGDINIKCSEEIGATSAARFFLSMMFGGNITMKSTFQNADVKIDGEKVFRASDAKDLETIEIYVAPNGNDVTGNGSESAPLATIDAARRKARDYSRTTMGAINVNIKGGDYYLDSPVEFDVSDSGTEFAPITYKACEGETVNILGSEKIDPSLITKVTDSAILDRVIDKNASAKLMQIDLSGVYDNIPRVYSYENITPASEYPFTVYCGDRSLSLARYPNNVQNEAYLTTFPTVKTESDGSKTIFYDDDVAERISKNWSEDAKKFLYVYGYLGQEWTSETYDASDMNYEKNSITIHGALDKGNFKAFKGRSRYCFMNLPEEIDIPGESFIDYDKRIIYFYPTDDFNADNVYVGKLTDSMFKMRDVSNVVIDGLNFLYTRKNAIDIRSSDESKNALARRNITIKNCTIAHTSWNGITLNGTGITVSGCKVYDTANGGISIVGGSRKELIDGESIIENCEIHDFNRSGRVYMAGIGAGSEALVIRNNTIYNGIHEMIAISANDVVIEYNEVYNAVTESSDMGAVYFGRDPSLMGIVIRNNYFHEIGSEYGGTGQQCIYVDDGNAGALIYGNIFRSASGTDCTEPAAVKTHGSQFTQVYNNIFIDTDYAYDGASWGGGVDNGQELWYRWLYDRVADKPHGIVDKVKHVDFDSDLWREHYKDTIWENMYTYINSELIEKYSNMSDTEIEEMARKEAPRYTNKVFDNVLINTKSTHQLWGKNFEENNNVTLDGSIFVSDGSDYTLTADGLAKIRETIPKFEIADFGKIGANK